MPRILKISNLDNLIERYVAGEPEYKLAREAGISRGTFRKRLLAANIIPRGLEAVRSGYQTWLNSMSPEERRKHMLPAHTAKRGRPMGRQQKLRGAETKQRRQTGVVPIETELAQRLGNLGFSITQQKAVDIYNVDIAVHEPRIAVEIFGGNWHASGHHLLRHFERVETLLNCKWNVLIVWVDGRFHPLTVGCDEYIIARSEEMSCLPSSLCEYWVIWGNGEPVSSARSYLNTPAIIERFRRSQESAG